MAEVEKQQAENIQAAMGDLLAIRRSIISFSSNQKGQMSDSSQRANLIAQYTALILCVFLVLIEIFKYNIISRTLINSIGYEPLKHLIIISIGLFLVACTLILYFTVKRAATSLDVNLDSYIRKNFQYLQNLNHVSDLAIKFVVIATLILAQRPEWIAGFLYLFTADYLFQGRYFTLKIRTAHLLGVALVGCALLQFYLQDPRVLWPLLAFAVVNIFSLRHLKKLKAVED